MIIVAEILSHAFYPLFLLLFLIWEPPFLPPPLVCTSNPLFFFWSGRWLPGCVLSPNTSLSTPQGWILFPFLITFLDLLE